MLSIAFNNLQEFIENYFENLDVQDEINNKLDEMAESGYFDNILTNYVSIEKIYDTTVSLLASEETFVEGQKIKTLGYYNINDGGGAEFYVSTVQSSDYFQLELTDGKYANMVISDVMNPLQFGAYGDDSHNDSLAIQSCINYASKIKFIPKTYLLETNEIQVLSNKIIDCNFSIFDVTPAYDRFYAFKLDGNNIKFKNAIFESDETNPLVYGGTTDTQTLSSNVYCLFIKGSNNIIKNIESNKCFATIYFNDGQPTGTIYNNNYIENIISNNAQMGLYTIYLENSEIKDYKINMSSKLNIYCHSLYVQKYTKNNKFINLQINNTTNIQYGGIDIHNNDNITIGAENLDFINCNIIGDYNRIIRIANAKNITFENLKTQCDNSNENYLLTCETNVEKIIFNNCDLEFHKLLLFNSSSSSNNKVTFKNSKIKCTPTNIGMINSFSNIEIYDCIINATLTNRALIYIANDKLSKGILKNNKIFLSGGQACIYFQTTTNDDNNYLLLDNYIETDGNSIITLNKTVGSENGIFNVLNNISKGNSYIGRFVSQTTLPSNINSVNNNII